MRALGGKHALIMLACCLIPLGLVAAVAVFRVDLGSIGIFGVVLLCPLLHVFMMRGMGHGEHSVHHETPGANSTAASAETREQPVAAGRKESCH